MTKPSTALLMLVALPAVHACAPRSNARPEPTTPGRLVIIGGGLKPDNAAVYQAIVDARAGDGPLCVVPTASGDPREAMDAAAGRLAEYGGVGSAKGILISTEDPSQAREPSVVAQLTTCSGFFFTGGSQRRILDVFLPGGDTTDAYRTLWKRWQEGAVVSGTSAGAAMMSRVMISGGSSTEAVAHGVVADRDSDGVWIRAGMGFLEAGIVDQHFLARGRIGRLLVAVLQEGSPPIGLGIDENTALIVDGESAVVVGGSGVVVVDARSTERTEPHRASRYRLRLAGAGDVIDLGSLEVRRGSAKSPVPVTEASLELPDDPFARWAFLHVMAGLAVTSTREATFTAAGATLRVVEDVGFSAFMTESTGGADGTPAGLSAGPFRVDLLPGANR